MDELHLRRGVRVPASELSFAASRSGGPGGQSVNTTSSKMELRWDVRASPSLTEAQRRRVMDRLGSRLTADGVLILTGAEHKSQHRNREAVLARFRAIVGEALEPPRPRRPTRRTKASARRRLEKKRRRSEIKRLRSRPEG